MVHNVLIIEDEDIAAKRLISMLKKILPEIEILGPLESVSESIRFFTCNPQPDLIFLDVQLADGMSFEIFDTVQILSPVIFTTAYDEYAIKAFLVNSIDYLLKPISEEKLQMSIQKYIHIKDYYTSANDLNQLKEILKKLQKGKSSFKTRFLVTKGDTLIPVVMDEIAYFLAEDKIVQLITNDNKKYIINYTLDSLEENLDPDNFFRVNRHCIISLKSVRKIYNHFNYKLKLDLYPTCSGEVILSKSRTTEFKQWLNH